MKPKKLSNTFRNSEHGEKAEPLVKGGQEIKMKGVLEEQESYYLQSSHLFRFDGADLEKPEPPFRASKQIMEQLQQDQAAQNWFADRPGFGGDPDSTPIPEWYQQLMTLLGPWMAGGGQMMFFNTNASYSTEDHTAESGDWHGFHSENWRIQREAREFVIQQLFDFDQDGVSLGMDPEVQDYIYNYLIDQNEANSWITPDMITPYNLHGLGHYYSQTNPNYTGDLELRWIGPDGQQVLSSSGGVMGPTGWINQFMNNGPGAEYALANEWQWPPSIDPFGLWQALAEGAPMPPDPFNAMISASQFLAQMVTYQDGTSNPEEFPEIDFDVDYEAAGYDSLLDYYINTSSLYAQNPIMLYYQYIAGGGDAYEHMSGSAFFYPHYLQQLLQTLGIDIDPSINTDYSGYATGNIDDFFTGPGMEEYQALLDLMSLHHEQYPGDSDSGMASMLQAYMSSNGDYGWNAQLGAYMDWYATGVQGGFIELSEAGYDTFEAAYTAYTGDQDNPFNWFWFDFSEEIGSDNFLNIYEYTLSPDGYLPDWGQTFGADSAYNEGGWYGNSYYDFDPQADINFVTDSEGYLNAFPIPEIAEGGIPEWYTFLVSTAQTWNSQYSTQYTGHSGMYYNIAAHTLDTIFDYDGDGNTTGTEIQDLADMGYPIGEMIINHFQGLLDEAGGGETLSITGNDLTAQLLAMNSYNSSQPWNGGNPAGGQSAGLVFDALYEAAPELQQFNTSQLIGWICNWGNSLSWAPDGTGTSIFNSSWHADFFNGSAYGQANGGNGMPAALDPMGLWAYNTTGEGTSNGWEMGGNTTGYYGFVTQYTMMEMFNWWGNQGMNTQSDEGLWEGGGNMFANNEGWSVSSGLPSGWFWLTAVNYMNGYNDTGQEGIWEPFYDFLESEGYNEEYYQDLQEYQLDNNQDWQELDSYYSLLHQYFSLAPGNPLMEANFFADQLAITDWYIQGVVGMGVAENPDSWNGPLLDEMSEVAIQNFQNALDSGSFWFDFTNDITDDNFLFSTNQDGPFWAEGFDASGWADDFTNINPSIGMGGLLGSDASLSLPAFIQSHGGMIDYNGDGRVDMGDLLGLITFLMSPQAFDSGLPLDASAFNEGQVNALQDSGLSYFYINNVQGNLTPNGSMNWMVHQTLEDNNNDIPLNIIGGSFMGMENISSSLTTIISTFIVFQFVNDFVENGVAPEWYSSIMDGELSSSTSTFNDFLSAVYPDWTVWSSENQGVNFEQTLQYSNIYQGLLDLLPAQESLVNYALYYAQQGIDINQQFVVSAGNTLDISSGGNSLVDGLWEDLASYSTQEFTVNVVSNNAEFFAAFDLNQDGDYGFEDNTAVTLIVALFMEYILDQGANVTVSEDINISEILFDFAENHASWSVITGDSISPILANLNAVQQFGSSTNVREALNYLLNVAQFDGFVSNDPDNPSASPEDVVNALSEMFTSVISSLYTAAGYDVNEVSPGVFNFGDSLGSSSVISISLSNAFTTFIENADNNAILQTIFENTDGSYYTDADGNQIPFSFTAAGLQALAGATYGAQAGSGASLYQTPEWNEAYQDIAQALGEAGVDIDFNGDGVYDMNDINILLSIAENGPVTEAQVQLAEILNYQSGSNSVEFGLDDVIMFMNFFGNPGPTTVYGYEGSSYTWIDGDGNQSVYNMDSGAGYQGNPMGANINMFGYFNDDGTWVDFGYDDLTPDDYFGPGWSATQTNNNETTS